MHTSHNPIVTVICTCYNHEEYVQEAINSVINQTYKNIQLIVVDNASTDNSIVKIFETLKGDPSVIFIRNKINIGICKAFNAGVSFAEGKYLIDLSADDILLPDRVELQVNEFEKLDENFGMLYSHVEYINSTGKILGNTKGQKIYPSGDIFKDILGDYLIPSPSTIFRKSSFLKLGSYNENLAFEDFDFWVKCSFSYKIQFLDKITTQKRVLKKSFSSQFYSLDSDRMLRSTLETYKWASERLRDKDEKIYLEKGLSYFFRQSVLLGHFDLSYEYLTIMGKPKGLKTIFINLLLYFRVNISSLYLCFVK